jgi:hypothetical protein
VTLEEAVNSVKSGLSSDTNLRQDDATMLEASNPI